VNQVTSASLRYPLSVFNKNSTLITTKKKEERKGKDREEKEEDKDPATPGYLLSEVC